MNRHVHMIRDMHINTRVYLQRDAWKANGRETKQPKLLPHPHSQVSACQKGPPLPASWQKLLHEWSELQGSLCHGKPGFWRSLL